jgi:hypothetical protein
MPEFLWQNHGRSYHWPGQCAATRFVNSSDTDDTEGAQFFFVTKTTAPVHAMADYLQIYFLPIARHPERQSRDPVAEA